MAANRPTPCDHAEAMPGATVRNWWTLKAPAPETRPIMPITVPNRPINGETVAMVASQFMLCSAADFFAHADLQRALQRRLLPMMLGPPSAGRLRSSRNRNTTPEARAKLLGGGGYGSRRVDLRNARRNRRFALRARRNALHFEK